MNIPEGWKLVPVEPTPEMKTAGISVEVYPDSPPELACLTWAEAKAIYQAMLAAAPTPPAQQDEVERLRAELAEAQRDAERYRWLRYQHQIYDPLCSLIWKKNGDRNSSEWVNTDDLDAAIDAARGAG